MRMISAGNVGCLLAVAAVVSLAACSTVSVKNDGNSASVTITKPMLFDMEKSVNDTADKTNTILKDMCKLDRGPRTIWRHPKSGVEIATAASAAATLGTLVKLLPSLSYSATRRCHQ